MVNGGFIFQVFNKMSYSRKNILQTWVLDIFSDHPVPFIYKFAFAIVCISLIILTIYSNTFDYSWQLDDMPNIVENSHIHLTDISWEGLKDSFYSDQRSPGVLYRPVSCLSFALNYYLGGLDPFGYHLVNILVHIFAAIFLFLFIFHSCNLPSLEDKYSSKSFHIAILATILWAVNPIQIQAVTYIVQRMASMAGMFFMLSMLLYLKGRTSEDIFKRIIYYSAFVLSSLLALGSKENAITLPFCILLYDIQFLQGGGQLSLKQRAWRSLALVSISTVVALFCLYFIYGNISSLMAGYNIRPFSMSQRLMSEPRVIWFYISLLIYPISSRFSIAHSFQISESLCYPLTTIISILSIIFVVIFLLCLSRKHPFLSFCFLFFFINHVVESTILPLELIFEQRNYIPSMLFFVPISIGLIRLKDLCGFSNSKIRYAVSAFIIFLLIGLGHATFMRNFAWKDPEALWLDAAEKAPEQFRVHHNLGNSYQKKGHWEKAVHEYEKALNSPVIQRKDEIAKTYYNLGNLYKELSDYENSEFFYLRAIDVRPELSPALCNLASLYAKRGDSEKADEFLFFLFAADPGNSIVNLNMGDYFLKEGDYEKAIKHLLAALKNKSIEGKALYKLGAIYKEMGLLGKAVIYLKRALVAEPYNLTPHLYLTLIYLDTGDQSNLLKEVDILVEFMANDETVFEHVMDFFMAQIDESGDMQHSSGDMIDIIIKQGSKNPKFLAMWKNR